MNPRLRTVWLWSMLLLSAVSMGCAVRASRATGNGKDLYLTNLNDYQKGQRPERQDDFMPGQVPAAVVVGFGGQTVTVEIVEISPQSEDAGVRTKYIPSDTSPDVWIWSPWGTGKTGLYNGYAGTGSYKAELIVGGKVILVVPFTVEKLP